MGNNLEIDVAGLGVADSVREAATGYLAADRVFAGDLEAGAGLGPWIATRRRIGLWRQGAGTKSSQRGDLARQFETLSRNPELAAVTKALLGAAPEIPELERLGAAVTLSGVVTRVVVRVEGTRQWEAALGGAAWAQEVEREFVLEANHAPWRDRQVRRLASVEVLAVEMHADPAPWRELIEDAIAEGDPVSYGVAQVAL